MAPGVRTPSAPGVRRPAEAATVYSGGRGQLSAAGAGAIALALTIAGMLVDLAVAGQPGFWMGAGLLVGALLAAARVRVGQLRAVVVMVPLLYLAAVVVAAVISPRSSAVSSFVSGRALTIGTDCVVHAPELLLAFVVAALLALLRGRRVRS